MFQINRDVLGQLTRAQKNQETREPFLAAVADFLKTVERSGGVYLDDQGHYRPLYAPEWISMGEVYHDLCCAIGREVLVSDPPTCEEG